MVQETWDIFDRNTCTSDEGIFETGKVRLLYCGDIRCHSHFSTFINMNTVHMIEWRGPQNWRTSGVATDGPQVTSDTGVALTQQAFDAKVTNSEEQGQGLLQVAEHRRS